MCTWKQELKIAICVWNMFCKKTRFCKCICWTFWTHSHKLGGTVWIWSIDFISCKLPSSCSRKEHFHSCIICKWKAQFHLATVKIFTESWSWFGFCSCLCQGDHTICKILGTAQQRNSARYFKVFLITIRQYSILSQQCPEQQNNKPNRTTTHIQILRNIFMGLFLFLLWTETFGSVLKSEYLLRCNKWKQDSTSAISRNRCIWNILDDCNETFFPNVHYLMKVLVTLPVSTASVERSFSTMKRVKLFLKNKPGNEWFTTWCLSVHHDILVSADEVMSIMAKKPRK